MLSLRKNEYVWRVVGESSDILNAVGAKRVYKGVRHPR